MDIVSGLVGQNVTDAESTQYVIPSAKSAFLDRLNNARREGSLCDVFFEVGAEKRKFCAHRLILGISSSVFRACFYGSIKSRDGDSESNPILIKDVDADAFQRMLDFIYSDQNIDSVEVTDHIVVHLLYAAEKYDILTLKHACLRQLKDLDFLNATKILSQALHYCDIHIMELCCAVIYSNVNAFLFSPEFLKCNDDVLEAIIQSDDFRPDSELHLLERLLERAAVKCREEGKVETIANKREALGDALYLVRFPLMSIEELQSVALLKILTEEELADLFLYLSNPASVPNKFITEKRVPFGMNILRGSQKEKLEIKVPTYCSVVRRFTQFEEAVHRYDNFTIFFKTDRKIRLVGVGVFDFLDGETDLRLQDFRIDFAPLENWHREAKQIEIEWLQKAEGKLVQLLLKAFPSLVPDRYYALRIEIKGTAGKKRYSGLNAGRLISTVHFEREGNVKFYFDNYDSTYNRYLNEMYFTL